MMDLAPPLSLAAYRLRKQRGTVERIYVAITAVPPATIAGLATRDGHQFAGLEPPFDPLYLLLGAFLLAAMAIANGQDPTAA